MEIEKLILISNNKEEYNIPITITELKKLHKQKYKYGN